MVREFHQKFGATLNDTPTRLFKKERYLRDSLIAEEWEELWKEMDKNNLTQIAKELADLLYVVYGTAAAYGLPIDDIFAEVHRSNMSKLDSDGNVIRRADGKVLKGKNYTPADVEGVLLAHANIA
jgi:predicted HAD superfamily Cof-like phosphohydrolase